jgi:hypothetical protein
VAQVFKLRERLGELSAWTSPVANEALSLAKSIEVVMNAIFGSNNPLDIHEGFLSVWLYELCDKERANERNRQHDSKRNWLRRTDKAQKRHTIRYLCPNNSYSRRDCWWWLPKRISESKVLEVQWRLKNDVELQGAVQPTLTE